MIGSVILDILRENEVLAWVPCWNWHTQFLSEEYSPTWRCLEGKEADGIDYFKMLGVFFLFLKGNWNKITLLSEENVNFNGSSEWNI